MGIGYRLKVVTHSTFVVWAADAANHYSSRSIYFASGGDTFLGLLLIVPSRVNTFLELFVWTGIFFLLPPLAGSLSGGWIDSPVCAERIVVSPTSSLLSIPIRRVDAARMLLLCSWQALTAEWWYRVLIMRKTAIFQCLSCHTPRLDKLRHTRS